MFVPNFRALEPMLRNLCIVVWTNLAMKRKFTIFTVLSVEDGVDFLIKGRGEVTTGQITGSYTSLPHFDSRCFPDSVLSTI